MTLSSTVPLLHQAHDCIKIVVASLVTSIVFQTVDSYSSSSFVLFQTLPERSLLRSLSIKTMATTSLYPLSTKEELLRKFVGKSIKDVPTPAAVLDLSKVRSNCSRVLEACQKLDFGWRAHIKTHKVR